MSFARSIYAVSIFLGLLLFLGLLAFPRHRIEKKSVTEIQLGMNQRQVEAILGGPPGDYGPESVPSETRFAFLPVFPEREEYWIAGHIAIVVRFDGNGKVTRVRDESRLVDGSWYAKIRSWFQLRE